MRQLQHIAHGGVGRAMVQMDDSIRQLVMQLPDASIALSQQVPHAFGDDDSAVPEVWQGPRPALAHTHTARTLASGCKKTERPVRQPGQGSVPSASALIRICKMTEEGIPRS